MSVWTRTVRVDDIRVEKNSPCGPEARHALRPRGHVHSVSGTGALVGGELFSLVGLHDAVSPRG